MRYLDKRKEQIEKEYDISKNYISEHTYFNDWQDNGDSPLDAITVLWIDTVRNYRKAKSRQEEYDKYQVN